MVADSGFMIKRNIGLLRSGGYQFIIGGRIKKVAKDVEQWIKTIPHENGLKMPIAVARVLSVREKPMLRVSLRGKRLTNVDTASSLSLKMTSMSASVTIKPGKRRCGTA